MKRGDLIETNKGQRGIIIQTEMMYPKHPNSPIGRVEVEWLGTPPHWWRRGMMFGIASIKMVSRA